MPYRRDLIPIAREMRHKATKQEQHLWYDFLRNHPAHFRRQKVISGFVVDFYCAKAKLVVEIDGRQHYGTDYLEYDNERTEVLKAYGISVIRFSNSAIDNSFDFVCAYIDKTVNKRLNLFTNSAPC
jgi:very-short-patch-repair endonuclease